MDKVKWLKAFGISANVLSVVAMLLTNWVDEQKLNKLVDEKVEKKYTALITKKDDEDEES